MKHPVDRDLIADRMHLLGLSERQVLARISMPQAAFRDMRLNGVIHGHINVRQLDEMSKVLGVSVGRILTVEAARESAEECDANDDAQTLIPLLATSPQPYDVARLARALDWTRTRLDTAVSGIPAALAGTGLELVESAGTVAVRGNQHHTGEQRKRLALARAGKHGLNVTEARVLAAVRSGDLSAMRNLGNADRVALGSIKNQGCVELDEAGRYRLTEQMRLALALD